MKHGRLKENLNVLRNYSRSTAHSRSVTAPVHISGVPPKFGMTLVTAELHECTMQHRLKVFLPAKRPLHCLHFVRSKLKLLPIGRGVCRITQVPNGYLGQEECFVMLDHADVAVKVAARSTSETWALTGAALMVLWVGMSDSGSLESLPENHEFLHKAEGGLTGFSAIIIEI
jgi:hypothetical protein